MVVGWWEGNGWRRVANSGIAKSQSVIPTVAALRMTVWIKQATQKRFRTFLFIKIYLK